MVDEFKVKEKKYVELSRLRVVLDVHKEEGVNPQKFAKKKRSMTSKVEENKGKYPQEEAILVFKAKDPGDKRKIVYNIQDGFRRYLISQELGLEKVCVAIIDEEAM